MAVFAIILKESTFIKEVFMLEKFQGKTILPFKEYLERQLKEGSDAVSKYHTWQRLGYPPNDGEAVFDYEEHGGAVEFSKRYISENKLPGWFKFFRKIVKLISELRF